MVRQNQQRRDRRFCPACRSCGADAVSWDLNTFCRDWGQGQGKTKESRGPRSVNANTVILRENVWNIHVSAILVQIPCALPWKSQSDRYGRGDLRSEVQQGPMGAGRGGCLADVGDPRGFAMSCLSHRARCGSWHSPKQQWSLPLSRAFMAQH